MKKFFKNIRKKSPARGGPPPEGSPKLDNRSTASLVLGYDVREKELGKLHKAAWLGDVAKVLQLARKDPSPLDKEKRTPLHLACANNQPDIVQELLAWKAKTNIGDADSRTPLMKAVECRHDSCVSVLLRDRVELDSVDKDGNTSLHIAACDGSSKIVKMLCQSGANSTIKNREGLAPLHLAVREKNEEVCRVIISLKGQVDIEDNNLRTPLMYACQDGSINLVKLFLDNGASTNHRDAKGWSADDCAVIQGHHACSQLISDHVLRQQRGSAASTPRSTAGSRSATPRGSSPFALPTATPRDSENTSFGLPAADAGGDESGDETISKASGKAGSDSWGDDTDVSLADDRKGKAGAAKVNLAKLVGHLPSESDDGDSQKTGQGKKEGAEGWGDSGKTPARRTSSKSLPSDNSVEENSWAAADSPISPRRSAVRVSFKGDKELSEVHDITATESEGESDPYSTIPERSAPVAASYVPSAAPASAGLQLSPEKQKAFMEDLGLGDVDDISEFSDGASEAKPAPQPAAASTGATAMSDSEWDSTVKSEQPKQGILKRSSRVEDGSDWDTTEAEDIAPPIPTSPQPVLTKAIDDENEVEDIVVMTTTPVISKEVEVMLRKKQEEAQDTDEEDSSSQNTDVKAIGASDLLSVTIEQSAKEYLGNDSLDVTPQGDLLQLDKPSQDSDWDSATEGVTPRHANTAPVHLPQKQDSDWDSTTETITPRPIGAQNVDMVQMISDNIMPIMEEEDDDEDGDALLAQSSSRAPSWPTSQPAVAPDTSSTPSAPAQVLQQPPKMEPADDLDDEDESAWDSDVDMLPSDAAPPLPLDTEVKAAVKASQRKNDADSDTDDEMDKTETVSEWEVEQKHLKETRQKLEAERLLKEQRDEKEKQDEERRMEEKRRQEEEEKRRKEAEEEEQKRKAKEEEEEARRQQWEQEEAMREEKLRAEAEAALKEELRQQQEDAESSDDDSMAQDNVRAKPVSSVCDQHVNEVATLNSCQSNSRQTTVTIVTTDTDVLSREELKRVEDQVKEEAKYRESSRLSTHGGAGKVGGYGGLHPQVSQGMPQASSSAYLAGPTALQIKQRLQISAHPSTYHSDGMESDDSLASDNERNDVHSSYPALLGSTQSFRPDFNVADDDVLSYTSTEFEGNDPAPPSSGPFIRDVLLNMNLSDPATLVHVQDYIRETKRHMEQERNQRNVLENKLRLLTKEKQDLSRKLDTTAETKQSLEQNKLDLEARIRSLEYNLSEEQEKKSNAEMLLTKTKEQLTRKEQQFTNELEGKQRAELTMRNIQLEMRAAQNTIKELEEEREELERQLQHEHNARKLQEQINDEQSRLAQQQHQETITASSAAVFRQAKTTDEDGDDEERVDRDKLNAELYAVKMELDRQRSRFKDEITLMATENEELQNRVEELKNDIKLNEEAMAHATMQYNVQLGNLRSELVGSTSSLDKERGLREKLEAELDSIQKRLEGSVMEKDRAVHARNELERKSQLEKQKHGRDVEHKDEEISSLRENNQHLNQRVHTLETKLGSIENELHVSNTSLLERTNQLQQLRQEAERHKAAQNSFDNNVRMEKEMNTKLQVKVESLQERLAQSQQEVSSLKQQVEHLHNATLNANSTDPHEHLNTVINTLRSDSDRTKTMLEERNSSLMEQVQRLKEDQRNAENRYNSVDSELRRLQTQHSEVTNKSSFAEAQLQLTMKAKEQLEQERAHLKGELDKAVERHRLSQEKCVEVQARLADMTDRLDRAERTSQLSTQHLATTSASFTAVTRSKEEMEDTVQRLNMDNARLEADLKHERERTELLQAELIDSKKVRNSLEALCANFKSTTAHLEEKLGDETANRVVFAKEAKDSKLLLKQELATRSSLGLKIVQLEKAKKSAQSKIQQAKTEGTDAKEQKAAIEVQLLEESQRNQQLQKEVTNLKTHLKAAKKKLKDAGMNVSAHEGNSRYAEFKQRVSTEGGKVSTPRGDPSNYHHYHHVVKSQVESGHVDVEALQVELEMKYRRDLNSKLEEINNYLESQALARDRLDNSRNENESRLASDKRRLEEENSNLKLQCEQAMAQRESCEMEARRFKQLYESEMQWRIRLSEQVHLSADKALHLKPQLVSDHKNRLYNSVGVLNKSAMSESSLHVSGLNGHCNNALSNKIQAELDRSIARHLEAAPHSDIVPVIRETEESLLNQSLARSSKDYIEILKRKYCVP